MHNKILAGAMGVCTLVAVSAVAVPFAGAQSTPVVLQSVAQTQHEVPVGHTNTLSAIVGNTTGQNQTVLVDLELYDLGGNKIAQQFYDHTAIGAGGTDTLTLTSPATLAAGTYIWKVGVFSEGWGGLVRWYDDPINFNVNNTMPTPGDVLVQATALSSTGAGSCPRLAAALKNTAGGPRGVLIDFELRDAKGTLVDQEFFDNHSVPSADSSVTNTCDVTLPAGQYFYSVGIFSPGWDGLLHWYNNIQTFTQK